MRGFHKLPLGSALLHADYKLAAFNHVPKLSRLRVPLLLPISPAV